MKSSLLVILPFVWRGSSQSLCDRFAYHASNGWYLNNNEWGASAGTGTQCTYIDSINSGGVSWHTDWDWTGGSGSVKSYPYSGRDLTTKRLVSQISSIPTVAEWRYEGQNLRCNVAYDLFTASDPNHSISSGDYEVMIWLGNLGPVNPIGGSPIATANLNGWTWNVHKGTNGDMRVYTFVTQRQITSFKSNIKPFFDYLVKNHGFPASSQYLLTLQFGTEPFTGDDARFIVGHWSGSVS